MKLKTAIPSIAAALLAATPFASAQNATTDPVGFVTANITAGTGSTKALTLFSAPLLDSPALDGAMVGTVTSFTSNSISNSSAAWTAGQLSNAATPNLIQITSGNATGRMFLISTSPANTDTTVTISQTDSQLVNLTQIGLSNGDSYKILACDTLSTLFGTPASTGVLGGANSTVSDTVTLVFNGSASTYFYSTTLSRWTRVAGGNPDATNTAVPPYYGIQYSRLAASPLSFTFTGNVPVQGRIQNVNDSGLTLISQYFPVDSTLASLGLQNIPGWVSNASSSLADKVILVSDGSASTYWFNGTNWRRIAGGSPISDTTVIAPGTSIRINKLGTSASSSAYNQPIPYTLN
jgi:hypothetical protein